MTIIPGIFLRQFPLHDFVSLLAPTHFPPYLAFAAIVLVRTCTPLPPHLLVHADHLLQFDNLQLTYKIDRRILKFI